jgi:hypothetical protein
VDHSPAVLRSKLRLLEVAAVIIFERTALAVNFALAPLVASESTTIPFHVDCILNQAVVAVVMVSAGFFTPLSR